MPSVSAAVKELSVVCTWAPLCHSQRCQVMESSALFACILCGTPLIMADCVSGSAAHHNLDWHIHVISRLVRTHCLKPSILLGSFSNISPKTFGNYPTQTLKIPEDSLGGNLEGYLIPLVSFTPNSCSLLRSVFLHVDLPLTCICNQSPFSLILCRATSTSPLTLIDF